MRFKISERSVRYELPLRGGDSWAYGTIVFLRSGGVDVNLHSGHVGCCGVFLRALRGKWGLTEREIARLPGNLYAWSTNNDVRKIADQIDTDMAAEITV